MRQIQNLSTFDEEDVKGFEKDPDKDLDDEKNLFVSFESKFKIQPSKHMDFCVDRSDHQAPPSFNSYDPGNCRGFFHITILPVFCCSLSARTLVPFSCEDSPILMKSLRRR